MAQIQEIYGTQGVKSMRELMVSKFAFQAVDHENAKFLSHIFGHYQYVEACENISYGANEIRDGISLSHHKKTEPLVPHEELMSLEPLHFYAKIANQHLCLKSSFSYYDTPSKNCSFVEKSGKDQTIGEILEQRGKGVPLYDATSDFSDDKEFKTILPFENERNSIKAEGYHLISSLEKGFELVS
jgi:hypothetical protein